MTEQCKVVRSCVNPWHDSAPARAVDVATCPECVDRCDEHGERRGERAGRHRKPKPHRKRQEDDRGYAISTPARRKLMRKMLTKLGALITGDQDQRRDGNDPRRPWM